MLQTDNTEGGGAGGHDERGGHGGRDGAHPFRNVCVEDLINLINSAEKSREHYAMLLSLYFLNSHYLSVLYVKHHFFLTGLF